LRRLELLGVAAPLGLLTGLLAWLLAGGMSAQANQLEGVHQRLAGLRPPAAAPPRGRTADAAALLGTPLFALTTGPGAVREPAMRLDGVSLNRRRMAALIAVDTAPAEWLSVGETRGGVTLQAVTSSSATLETALGVKTLSLGDQSAASAPPAGAPVATAAEDRPPPGFRSPPEPASAPMPR